MNGANGAAKRLERKVKGRWLAGVCAGVADYFNVDPAFVRVAFVVTSIWGLGLVAYMAGWVLIPEEGESVSIAEKFINKTGS